MTDLKIYPGMISKDVEMFVVENELKFIQNGRVASFSEFPYALFHLLREAINTDESVAQHLHIMHPSSEYRRIEQFGKCRFGGLDFKGDICNDTGKLQDGEYWECPLRGNCRSEGVLCKMPKVGDERLTSSEIKLIQLITTDKTNEVIAEEMDLPLGSLHKSKKNLYEKFKINTKQCLTKTAMAFNLI